MLEGDRFSNFKPTYPYNAYIFLNEVPELV